MRATAAVLAVATALTVGCSGSLAKQAASSSSDALPSTTEAAATTTTLAVTTTAPPLPTRPSTTTTSTSLDIPPGATTIAVATAAEVAAVVGTETWDYALPVPQAGLAQSSWTADGDHGGALVLSVPASAADTAGFFRLRLSQRGFAFTEERAGTISSLRLGDQGAIAVSPTAAATCSVTITVTL